MVAARARRKPAPDQAPAAPPPPAFGTYRLDQLGFCQCKFPSSTVRGEHRFCGRPTTFSRQNRHASWCDEHLAVVFTPRLLPSARKVEAA